jgi:hypothetical protein
MFRHGRQGLLAYGAMFFGSLNTGTSCQPRKDRELEMNLDIKSLFVDAADGKKRLVTATTHQDTVTALSAALPSYDVALLHILYPRTDARTHVNRDALVAALNRHGMHDVARLIEEAHHLLFRDPKEAWRVLHEIRNDSLAIGPYVYCKGLAGSAAEEMLDIDAHIDCPECA